MTISMGGEGTPARDEALGSSRAGHHIVCAGCGQPIPQDQWDWTLILDAGAVIYFTCLLELDTWILGR